MKDQHAPIETKAWLKRQAKTFSNNAVLLLPNQKLRRKEDWILFLISSQMIETVALENFTSSIGVVGISKSASSFPSIALMDLILEEYQPRVIRFFHCTC